MSSRFGATPGQHPWVIAHRGVSAHCPENTRAAFEAAVRMKADAIELDLQFTADRQIVISHNSTLNQFGHPEINISEATADHLRQYDAGSWMHPQWGSERIMLLPEVLDECAHQIPLLLEVKLHPGVSSSEFADELVKVLQRHRNSDQIFLLCFDLAFLQSIHFRIPSVRLIWNIRTLQGLHSVCRQNGEWLYGIDCRITALTPEAVATIHMHGCRSFAFTCNSTEQVVKAQKIGVDGIITDDPDNVRHIMNAQNFQAG